MTHPTGNTPSPDLPGGESPERRLLAEIRKWMDADAMGPWDAKFCREIDAVLATPAAEPAPDAGLVEALRGVVSGWEALPGGDYPPMRVQSWLVEDMKPAIDAARAALSRAGERHD